MDTLSSIRRCFHTRKMRIFLWSSLQNRWTGCCYGKEVIRPLSNRMTTTLPSPVSILNEKLRKEIFFNQGRVDPLWSCKLNQNLPLEKRSKDRHGDIFSRVGTFMREIPQLTLALRLCHLFFARRPKLMLHLRTDWYGSGKCLHAYPLIEILS